MTIIAFFVNTNYEMNQKTFHGPTYLHMAKYFIDNFIKLRSKESFSRNDHYILLTSHLYPDNIKVGLKDNIVKFMEVLKSLRADCIGDIIRSLKQTFEYLNDQIQTNMLYKNHNLKCFENIVIYFLTDFSSFSYTVDLPKHILFNFLNWHQKFFPILFDMHGNNILHHSIQNKGIKNIIHLSQITGASYHVIKSQTGMLTYMEWLLQKIQNPTVTIKLSGPNSNNVGKDESLSTNSNVDIDIQDISNSSFQYGNLNEFNEDEHNIICNILINSNSFWPLPDMFDHLQKFNQKLNRTPILFFQIMDDNDIEYHLNLMSKSKVPFDKFEFENGPSLKKFCQNTFFERSKYQIRCPNIMVEDSNEYVPIGFIEFQNVDHNIVKCFLYIFPYNYPTLTALIDEYHFKPYVDKEWDKKWNIYISNLPPFYVQPTRKAFEKMGLSEIHIDNHFIRDPYYHPIKYLPSAKSKNQVNYERAIMPDNDAMLYGGEIFSSKTLITSKLTNLYYETQLQDQHLQQFGFLNELYAKLNVKALKIPQDSVWNTQVLVYPEFRSPNKITPPSSSNLKINKRDNLLKNYTFLRTLILNDKWSKYNFHRFIGSLPTTSNKNEIPIAEMGNYQDYKKNEPALRPIINPTVFRQQHFGNPFKVDKRMIVDEADMENLTPSYTAVSNTHWNKRLKGPLPKDFVYVPPSYKANQDDSPITVTEVEKLIIYEEPVVEIKDEFEKLPQQHTPFPIMPKDDLDYEDNEPSLPAILTLPDESESKNLKNKFFRKLCYAAHGMSTIEIDNSLSPNTNFDENDNALLSFLINQTSLSDLINRRDRIKLKKVLRFCRRHRQQFSSEHIMEILNEFKHDKFMSLMVLKYAIRYFDESNKYTISKLLYKKFTSYLKQFQALYNKIN